MTLESPLRVAISCFAISALLHVLAPFVSGFDGAGWRLAAMLPVFLVMIYGLARGWRWFAYLCFFIGAVGGIVAMALIWSLNPVPAWIYIGITGANWLASASLFVALWRARPDAGSK